GNHEKRAITIIADPESSVNKLLTGVNKELPAKVAALVSEEMPQKNPPVLWQRALISSQLDLDRLDFLRRDSLFSGAEYGNFDWYRIIHTMRLAKLTEDIQEIWVFWPDKTKYAIEEYLFSRFYMYQSVYFHHTTRGFEQVLEKILERAKWLALQNGSTFGDSILPSLKPFFQEDKDATLQQFLGLTDYAVLAQVWEWKNAEDDILSDLAEKFFGSRDEGFKVARVFDLMREVPMLTKIPEKVEAANKYLKQNNLEPDYYLLSDEFDVEVYKPYAPELEELLRTPENIIMISDGTTTQEISNLLPRLKPIAQKLRTARYYCPEEHKGGIRERLS
ncbi:MAG: HD domain-containing protein, partial [Planctomycetota bacterium]